MQYPFYFVKTGGNNLKVKCMLDKTQYSNKPQGIEIAKITNRLEHEQIEIDIKELADHLIHGCTFKPSFLNGKKESDWVSQQLFALDFDEGTNIESELNRCKELNILPCFGYTSFSHTSEHNKFRLVFCANEVITDYNTAKQLQLTLMDIFNHSDEKCKNLSRLYFGGRQLIYSNYDNKIDYKKIIEKYSIKMPSNVDVSNHAEKKPQDNKGISNISILSWGEKPPVHGMEDNNYNIKALRNRDAEYLKKRINNPHILLENNQAFFDYIKGYDLGKLLEIKYPTSFRCILHEDNKPSAGIFKNNEGTYIYHCFSCGVSYNIINLIEVLGNFKSRPKAYKFMREIFNLEIQETEWQKEQKEILMENLKVLTNGELKENCPTAYNNISRNLRYLQQLILIAMDNVHNENLTDNEDNVAFYASTKYLCQKLHMSPESAKEVSKKNVLFAYHKLLNKLDDTNIPEDMLKRGQAIGVNKDNKNQKHINYYSIPSYTTNSFKDIEEQGQKWKNNNYTMKGLSREMFYRTEGSEVANKLYPQYKKVYNKEQKQVIDRTTSKLSDELTIRIVKYIFEFIDTKGYCTENDIIQMMNTEYSKTLSATQIKKSLNEILQGYDLKRIRANKQIKQQYGITGNGYPFILLKK